MNEFYVDPRVEKATKTICEYYSWKVRPGNKTYVDYTELEGREEDIGVFMLNWNFLVENTKTFGKLLQIMRLVIMMTVDRSNGLEIYKDLSHAIGQHVNKTELTDFDEWIECRQIHWHCDTYKLLKNIEDFKDTNDTEKNLNSANELIEKVFGSEIIDNFKKKLGEHKAKAIDVVTRENFDAINTLILAKKNQCASCLKVSLCDLKKKQKNVMKKLLDRYYLEYFDLNPF